MAYDLIPCSNHILRQKRKLLDSNTGRLFCWEKFILLQNEIYKVLNQINEVNLQSAI